MRLERTVEYHEKANTFMVFGQGLPRECVEVAGTRANIDQPGTVASAARAIAGRVGDIRRGDFVEITFVHVSTEQDEQ